MKDKRNCSMNYPVYQPPVMVPPMGMHYGGYQSPMGIGGIFSNTYEQQTSNLEQQINLLDQRVTRLEKSSNTTSNYNKYNDSNYYMV